MSLLKVCAGGVRQPALGYMRQGLRQVCAKDQPRLSMCLSVLVSVSCSLSLCITQLLSSALCSDILDMRQVCASKDQSLSVSVRRCLSLCLFVLVSVCLSVSLSLGLSLAACLSLSLVFSLS